MSKQTVYSRKGKIAIMEGRQEKSFNLIERTKKQNEKTEEDALLTREFDFCTESSDPSKDKMLEIFKYYTFDGDRDLYGNLRCDFLQIKTDKSRSCINVLGMFKPGELLKSIWIKE